MKNLKNSINLYYEKYLKIGNIISYQTQIWNGLTNSPFLIEDSISEFIVYDYYDYYFRDNSIIEARKLFKILI